MSEFLDLLILRERGEGPVVRPRLPARFEPPPGSGAPDWPGEASSEESGPVNAPPVGPGERLPQQGPAPGQQSGPNLVPLAPPALPEIHGAENHPQPHPAPVIIPQATAASLPPAPPPASPSSPAPNLPSPLAPALREIAPVSRSPWTSPVNTVSPQSPPRPLSEPPGSTASPTPRFVEESLPRVSGLTPAPQARAPAESLAASEQPRPLQPVLPELSPRPAAQGALPARQDLPPAPRPTVRINIGRIEVRAARPEKPQPAPRPAGSGARKPRLSLEDYLKQRNGGRS